jgi:hypothetical protein
LVTFGLASNFNTDAIQSKIRKKQAKNPKEDLQKKEEPSSK